MPCPKAGLQRDDKDDRSRNTVGVNSIVGKGLPPTESASDRLNDSSQPQSHSLDQETSRLNILKADDKDTQQDYRCPQCSFFCWLCHSAKAPGSHGIDEDDSDGYGYDYEYESDQSEEMNGNPSKKRKRADGLVYIGPGEEHFEEYILAPAGVQILAGNCHIQPEDIPSDDIQNDPSIASRVHLNIDDNTARDIYTQLAEYHERSYLNNAPTFTKLITQYLAPFDRYINPKGPEAFMPLWREKWRPCREGPSVSKENGFIYDWDIESDMTYMVALNLFERDFRKELRKPNHDWLLAEPAGVCPYLTFTFMGDRSHAKHQISAASVLWLYQRKSLKDKLNSSDFSDIRHYSIAIDPIRYQIWVTEFDGKEYSSQKIYEDSFLQPEGVLHYAKWSNAIHKWGLGPNARSFKRDVETLLRKI
jgi:hypothetical protein